LSCRLLSVGDKPGHDFFRLLAQKLEEYQVPMPTVQIEYKNLTVKTQAMVGSAGIPTAGNFGPQLLKVRGPMRISRCAREQGCRAMLTLLAGKG
jgi:hypothetical protein